MGEGCVACSVGLVRRGEGFEGRPGLFRVASTKRIHLSETVPLDDVEVARGGARAPPRPGGGGAGTPGRREGVVARTLSVREKSGVRADPNARGGERQSGAQFLRARETASKCNSDSDAAKETLTRPRSTRAAHTRREMESTAQIRRAAPCPRAHRAPPALPLRDPSRGLGRRTPPDGPRTQPPKY